MNQITSNQRPLHIGGIFHVGSIAPVLLYYTRNNLIKRESYMKRFLLTTTIFFLITVFGYSQSNNSIVQLRKAKAVLAGKILPKQKLFQKIHLGSRRT